MTEEEEIKHGQHLQKNVRTIVCRPSRSHEAHEAKEICET